MDKRETETLYSKLGVPPSASSEEIHHAYAALTEKFLAHTEDSSSPSTQVTEDEKIFRELTQAYRTLVDTESRRLYDSTLQVDLQEPVVVSEEHVSAHAMARYQEVMLPQHEVTEAWQKEREYFEEHYDEILKPAPKVNLIATGVVDADGVMDESSVVADEGKSTVAVQASDAVDENVSGKFGTFPSDREMSSFITPRNPRRPVAFGRSLEPFDLLMYIGMPLFAVILLLEYYFFVMQ